MILAPEQKKRKRRGKSEKKGGEKRGVRRDGSGRVKEVEINGGRLLVWKRSSQERLAAPETKTGEVALTSGDPGKGTHLGHGSR